ncbi:molecular chaperone TorD family protein [Eggerthellaceae bacterium 24-137]
METALETEKQAAVSSAVEAAYTTAADDKCTEGQTLLAELCDQRAALYGIVSRLFLSEVDDELLAHMRSTPFPVHTGNESLDCGYALIVSYLSHTGDEAAHDLAIDYVRTFIGSENTAFSAAYPFESVYTSEKRLLMQEARDEVAAIFKAEGFTVVAGWRDPEDHIGLELSYMQMMSQWCAKVLREGREESARQLLEKQRNFMADHIISWVPMMLDDMREKTQTDFYRGLSFLTEGLLMTDAELLDDVLG